MREPDKGTTDSSFEEKRIRVLCAEDADDLAFMLETLFGFQPDVEVVGRLRDADHLVSEVKRLKPDVLVLDLTMPGVSPLDALAELKTAALDCRVVVHSGRDDSETVRTALARGAHSLVSKGKDFEDVLAAVRSAARG